MRRDRRLGVIERRVGGLAVRIEGLAVAQAAVIAAVAGLGSLRAGNGLAASAGWSLAAVVTLQLSVLVHEGGHVIAARALGLHVHGVKITGALQAAVVRQGTRERGTEVAVALAGPAATSGLVLAGVALVLTGYGWLPHLGWMLLTLNAVLLILSMPPLPGTDGTLAWRARSLPAGEHARRRARPMADQDPSPVEPPVSPVCTTRWPPGSSR